MTITQFVAASYVKNQFKTIIAFRKNPFHWTDGQPFCNGLNIGNDMYKFLLPQFLISILGIQCSDPIAEHRPYVALVFLTSLFLSLLVVVDLRVPEESLKVRLATTTVFHTIATKAMRG